MATVAMIGSVMFWLAGLLTEDKELQDAFDGLSGILFLVALCFWAMNL